MEGFILDRYHVYKWVLDDFILIDRVTMELRFFKTNYEHMMGDYHINNPSVSKLSKQKINGLIKRINNGLNFDNGYVIDKYVYHLLMTDEQRSKCKVTNSLLNYELKIKESDFVTSGNDYNTVVNEMKEFANSKAIEAKKAKAV